MNRCDARVLVVDDAPLSRLATNHALQQLGFRLVEEAAAGADALELLEARPFDLVISNWQLPDMSGRELLHVIRHTPDLAGTPVVIATPVTADVVAEAAEAGVSAFLPRPIALQTLEDVLRLFIGGPGSLRSPRPVWNALEN